MSELSKVWFTETFVEHLKKYANLEHNAHALLKPMGAKYFFSWPLCKNWVMKGKGSWALLPLLKKYIYTAQWIAGLLNKANRSKNTQYTKKTQFI